MSTAVSRKRVVVTGGSSGLGAALVRLLADLGAASITVLDRQVEPSLVNSAAACLRQLCGLHGRSVGPGHRASRIRAHFDASGSTVSDGWIEA